jgi:hypothetical protein
MASIIDEQTLVFYLEKPTPSIFVGLQCREFATTELLYGFVNAKMGIKLRKSKVVKYEDEQTHYKHYQEDEMG